MGKYNKILVAMDGSEASKNALRQSFKLALDEKRWITVVSINPPYQGDLALIGVSNIGEVLKGPGEKILAEAQKIADEEKATIKTRLEEGDPFKKIIEIAEEERCDLIVMGRRGMSRLERALMGSVTAKVIGHFKGKTLVIPRDSTIGWKTILVATDGSKYSEAAVEEAINYAKSYEGSLKVVTAVDVTEEFEANAPDLVDKLIEKAKSILNEVKKKAEDAGIPTETLVRQGEPYKVIIDIAKQVNADIIIMGSHGRTGLTRLFMGSVTSRVIGHTPYPVMIVNK
jgi:nucleotide-binding universal stress UspA family protein